jgi:competence protein ComEC
MPWAMIACLLMPFGLEAWALVSMGWGVDAIIWVARTVAAWPGAVVAMPALPVAGLAAASLGGLWLCLWQRRWRLWGLVPIALGCATVLLERPPDVIVAADGKTAAVRAGDGSYMFSTAHPGRIVEETWTRRGGTEPGPVWPREGTSADASLACDPLGCTYRTRGRTVALVRDPGALGEDCRRADLVVSPVPARRACRGGALTIDRIDLWRSGGHAIWLDPGEVRIERVDEWRGRRPWVPARLSRAERGLSSADKVRPAAPAP